ncbi:MAG TPA: hypothetical protein VGO90_14435 [Chthoniobacteraceae bacterium]|nr:hypothetical protein [Chthoniobacteraceae bacterium]
MRDGTFQTLPIEPRRALSPFVSIRAHGCFGGWQVHDRPSCEERTQQKRAPFAIFHLDRPFEKQAELRRSEPSQKRVETVGAKQRLILRNCAHDRAEQVFA